MKALLRFARLIDGLNESVGRLVVWLVLAASLISAGNAVMRYGLNTSSNAWLEIQWYLFGLVFLMGAGYTLKHNGHVRIDVLYGRFSPRTRAWVDLMGGVLFLLPMSGLIAWLGWDFFMASYAVAETSPDAGGLPRWPIKLAVPVGFSLLWLQGVSEVIKRAGVLWGGLSLAEEHSEEVA